MNFERMVNERDIVTAGIGRIMNRYSLIPPNGGTYCALASVQA